MSSDDSRRPERGWRAVGGPSLLPAISRRGFLGWCSAALVVPAVAACSQRGAADRTPAASTPAAQAPTSATLGTMRINYSAIAAAMAGIWMANDTGAWRECGIEPDLSNVNASSKVLPALLNHDFDGTTLDVMAGVRAIADGGEVVYVGGMTNRQIFSVFTHPDIRQPADLAGGTWGITRMGSSTYVAAQLALQQWGLTVDDITFVQLGKLPTIFAALPGGQIDAAIRSPQSSFK